MPWVTCCFEDRQCGKAPCIALIDDGIKIESFHECFYSTVSVKWRLATKLEATFPKCTHCAAWIKEGPQPAPNSVSHKMPDVNTLKKMLVATGEISEFGLDTNGADRIIKLCHDVLVRHFGQ